MTKMTKKNSSLVITVLSVIMLVSLIGCDPTVSKDSSQVSIAIGYASLASVDTDVDLGFNSWMESPELELMLHNDSDKAAFEPMSMDVNTDLMTLDISFNDINHGLFVAKFTGVPICTLLVDGAGNEVTSIKVFAPAEDVENNYTFKLVVDQACIDGNDINVDIDAIIDGVVDGVEDVVNNTTHGDVGVNAVDSDNNLMESCIYYFGAGTDQTESDDGAPEEATGLWLVNVPVNTYEVRVVCVTTTETLTGTGTIDVAPNSSFDDEDTTPFTLELVFVSEVPEDGTFCLPYNSYKFGTNVTERQFADEVGEYDSGICIPYVDSMDGEEIKTILDGIEISIDCNEHLTVDENDHLLVSVVVPGEYDCSMVVNDLFINLEIEDGEIIE